MMRHYYFSQLAYDHRLKTEHPFGHPRTVQFLPNNQLSTFNSANAPGSEDYHWEDKVYLGEFESRDVTTLRLD